MLPAPIPNIFYSTEPCGLMKVFVTRRIPEKGLRMLEERYDVEVNPEDRVLTKEEIIEGIRDADALLCLLTDPIDKDVIDAGKKLRIISNYAVGYNNIDVEYASKKGIIVTNTPGVLTETTADLAWALLMAVARRVVEGDKFMREGKFRGWAPMLMLGTDIYGKTLGIVGMGKIGQAVARRAKGFDMKVIYYSRKRKPEIEKETGAEFVDLPTLMKESDFISLHVPLTPETRNMINRDMLELMKPSAYLINTARGEVVDEPYLIEMLKKKRIRGAALDVFWGEPLNVNPELYELDNVVLAPHMGSASLETRTKMAVMAAQAIIDVFEGREPVNRVI
jgi:glyoxylate reductase